jgi:hypothetical protein
LASKNKKVRQRSFFLMLMYFILMIVLIVRLGYYQIVKGEEYSRQAYYAQTRNRIINPKRGTIYDRNGQGLAISGSVETVSVNPQDFKDKFKDSPEKIDEIASTLAKMLDMKDEEVKAKLTENSSWAYVKRKIDKEIGNRVREYLIENSIDSICVDEDSKRFFPNGKLASHVLGFTGVDDQGLNGIEKYYDAMLSGEPGMVMVELDAGGRQVKYSPEGRLRILKIEYEYLEEYMRSLKDPDSIFKTRMRMTELQTEIERLTGTLNKWSDLVELSTIYIRLEEKYPEEMTLKKTNTYWDRLKNSIKNSLTGIVDAFGDLVIFIIEAIPTLVILGILFLIGLRIYKKHIKKKKALPPEEKKEQ